MTPKPPKGWVLIKKGERVERGYLIFIGEKWIMGGVFTGSTYTNFMSPMARRSKGGKV